MEKLTLGSREWKKLIVEGAGMMGVAISQEQADQLAEHCRMLLLWNRKMNLTSITDPYEVAVKHVLDSLAPVGSIPPGSMLLDMGSGGGFPGIPIKIVSSKVLVCLADSSRKKVSFLKHVIRSLSLEDCSAITGRVEDLAVQEEHMNRFDVVVCRSFAPLRQLIMWGIPFLAEKGRIIALKGSSIKEEIDEINTDKNMLPFFDDRFSMNTVFYKLSYANLHRSMVVIEKK